MKPEPKFVPGEMVIVDSKRHPEFNGIQVIDKCLFGLTRRLGGDYISERYSYTIVGVDLGVTPDGKVSAFAEVALHKLPPNTPTTFDESIWKPSEVTQ